MPFTIVVDRSGDATIVIGSRLARGHVPVAIVKKFYADLQSAGALNRLPIHPCPKSSSFGTTLGITWKNTQTPNIACPQSGVEKTLMSDVGAVAGALDIGRQVRRTTPTPQPLVPRLPPPKTQTPKPRR